MQSKLSNLQVKKGIVIAACFVVLRLITVQLWNSWFGGEYHLSVPFLFFLFGVFLVMSVGLVYVGFTRWVGIDLKSWWFKRDNVLMDIVWGIGTLICLGIFVFGVGIVMLVLNLMPSSLVASPDNVSLTQTLTNLVLGWFFGFTIASFQEETIFRGFLQEVFGRKFGEWGSNLLQAAFFSIAHLGMEPIKSIGNIASLLLLRFGIGVLLGWLRMKRRTLLTAGIAHGFIG